MQSDPHVNHDHLVLLYGDNAALLSHHLSNFAGDALAKQHAALVVASDAHASLCRRALENRGIDTHAASREGRLLFLNAADTLSALTVDGTPDAKRFHEAVGQRIESLAWRYPVRAYGEMVGILWERGRDDEAIALEKLWIDLKARTPFDLLCAYPIDVFGNDFCGDRVHRIMCTHDQLVSTHPRLKEVLDHAMRRVLGRHAREVRYCAKNERRPAWGHLPEPEATILWLRENMPSHADDVIRDVRGYFSRSENA